MHLISLIPRIRDAEEEAIVFILRGVRPVV